MNLKKTLTILGLTLLAVAMSSCGDSSSSSNQITFALQPSSAMAQMNSETAISAVNFSNPINTAGVEFDWTIQEAAAAGINCTRILPTVNFPPVPAECAAFGALDITMPIDTPEIHAIYVAPNQSGIFHIIVNAHLATNMPNGPTGQQTAVIMVQ